jgi:hypothetical protein
MANELSTKDRKKLTKKSFAQALAEHRHDEVVSRLA